MIRHQYYYWQDSVVFYNLDESFYYLGNCDLYKWKLVDGEIVLFNVRQECFRNNYNWLTCVIISILCSHFKMSLAI